MKIGILTYPLNYNFGNLLQAYALQIHLKEIGVEVEFINRKLHKKSRLRKMKDFVKRIYIILFYQAALKDRQYLIMNAGFDLFIKHYLYPKTKPIFEKKHLRNIVLKQHYDTVIVGSDQVWRYKYMKDNIYDFFLDFVPDHVNRVAYAASFGTDKWQFDDEQTKRITSLVQKFKGVSVREDTAVLLCRNHLNIDAIHLIDPTLLLDKKYYYSLINEVENIEIPSNFFQYILDSDDNNDNIINQLNSLLNLTICKFTLKEMICGEERIKTNKPIAVWLKSIYKSKFIVTDSFHGTVFAIIFNKPFLVLENGIRGLTRISSLLKMFEIENRLIKYNTESKKLDFKEYINTPFNWDRVNEILKIKRKEAEEFHQTFNLADHCLFTP